MANLSANFKTNSIMSLTHSHGHGHGLTHIYRLIPYKVRVFIELNSLTCIDLIMFRPVNLFTYFALFFFFFFGFCWYNKRMNQMANANEVRRFYCEVNLILFERARAHNAHTVFLFSHLRSCSLAYNRQHFGLLTVTAMNKTKGREIDKTQFSTQFTWTMWNESMIFFLWIKSYCMLYCVVSLCVVGWRCIESTSHFSFSLDWHNQAHNLLRT